MWRETSSVTFTDIFLKICSLASGPIDYFLLHGLYECINFQIFIAKCMILVIFVTNLPPVSVFNEFRIRVDGA